VNQTSDAVRMDTRSCRYVCGPAVAIMFLYLVAQVRRDLSVACECSTAVVLRHVSTSPSLQETKCNSRMTGHFTFIYDLFNDAINSSGYGESIAWTD
jgi:hypothetical protein